MIPTIIAAMVTLKSITMMTAVASIFKVSMESMGKIPFVGVFLGLAAAAAAVMAMRSSVSSVGDAILPASGKPMISTKEGGLMQGTANDDILMAPGLAGAAGGGGRGPNIQQQKAMFSEVMAPLFRNLQQSVDNNTSVNQDIKGLQEEAPRRMAERINDNSSRY